MGKKLEGSRAHLLVLGIEVGAVGKWLVGGEGQRLGTVDAGKGAPVVLSTGLRAPEHHRATRKVMLGLVEAMWGWSGLATSSSSSPSAMAAADWETGSTHEYEALGFYL